MKTVPLVGYSDKLSGRPGDRINFMVSSEHKGDFSAELFRSISADPNPQGLGIVEQSCDEFFPKKSFLSRKQAFHPGSYAISEKSLKITAEDKIIFSVMIYPTLQCANSQSIIEFGQFCLNLNTEGKVVFGSDAGSVTSSNAVSLRSWQRVEAQITKLGQISISLGSLDGSDTFKPTFKQLNSELDLSQNASVVIAGQLNGDAIINCFNGKIEQPEIYEGSNSFASWDFSRNISNMTVPGNGCPNLKLINAPTRAVTGAFWDASEMNWQHKPEHYASIAFHEDDIYDFNWEPDFSFAIPSNMPSGIYIMRISCGDDYDAMPFFVCPEKDKPQAKVCVLVSTFTYVIYGNHARPDYDDTWLEKIADWNAYPHNPAQFQNYGLSTYNNHSDGSGICHASHKRPLFNLRPGYLTFGQANCSGLRHFQADSHLISWLHAKGIEYEIITDEELHNEGVSAIQSYEALLTGTHPESILMKLWKP